MRVFHVEIIVEPYGVPVELLASQEEERSADRLLAEGSVLEGWREEAGRVVRGVVTLKTRVKIRV